jgi:hypothetical protein
VERVLHDVARVASVRLLRFGTLLSLAAACGDDAAPSRDAGRNDAAIVAIDSGFDASGPDAGTDAGAPISGPLDPFVDVAPGEKYGEHTFIVPARTNWVMTGLYLRAGETAEIGATGSWTLDGSPMHGPEGAGTALERGCRVGSFVARVGLAYEDTALACIGESGTLTAPRDGIVYVGGIVSTDLGETYESRRRAEGELSVVVASGGSTVPTLGVAGAMDFDFGAIESGFVELRSEHVIATLPIETAIRDRATLAAALERLDTFYELHEELRGAVPYFGQRIRFYPDAAIESVGYMLAGNPVRMVPDLVSGTDAQRITRAGEEGTDVWGFAHELGHDFTLVHGTWTYMIAGGLLEGWPNVFTVHALRAIDHPQAMRDDICVDRERYIESGTYEELRDDPWLVLCFLLELEERYGFEFFRGVFERVNAITNDDIPYDPESDAPLWRFMRDLFNDVAGEDVTPLMTEWKLPT